MKIAIKIPVTALLGYTTLFLCATSAISQEPLSFKSFSLRSKITTIDHEAETTQVVVHERYSAEQQRARIDFKYTRKPVKGSGPSSSEQVDSGEFYLDAQQNIALLIDKENRIGCRRWTVEAFSKALYLDALKPDNVLSRNYIVGPALLLLIVNNYRDKMRPVTGEANVKVHNLDTLLYTFDYPAAGQKLSFFIYYSQVALLADQRSMPLAIHMLFGEESKENAYRSAVMVDYAQVEYLDAEETNLWTSRMIKAKQQVVYDPFIIEPVFGCSAALESKADDALAKRLQSATRFSFRAEIDLFGGHEMQCSVAYDARLKMMRYDISNRKETLEAGSGMRRMIFDLNINRMYHVLERATGSTNSVDMIMDLSDKAEGEAAGKKSQCMVAKLTANGDRQEASLAKLLAGADNFVYMGKARVRGVRALVYEAFSGVSPFWLEQPVVFSNGSSVEYVREPDKGQTDDNGNIVLTVLLYVTESLSDPQVLLMELNKFDKKQKSVLRPQRSLAIYDFSWDLEPQTVEGDRQAEFFSLGDSCAAGLGKNVYARIDLELESEEPLSEEAAEELGAVHQRDAAVIASLQSSLNVPVPMLFDLKTKYLEPAKHSVLPDRPERKQLIRVSFRLAEHVQDNLELIYIGQGRQKPFASGYSLSLTRNFQACFFLASHLRFSTYFGYNPHSRMCAILTKPIKGPFTTKPSEETPPGIVKGEGDALELYRISHTSSSLDFRYTDPNSFMRALTMPNYRLALLNRKVSLPVGGSATSFALRRLVVDDRDLKTSLSTGENLADRRQLDTNRYLGFALNETAAGNRRVAPAPASTYTWQPVGANGASTDESEASMTLDQCRGACLADVDCRSFSICIRNSKLHCVLSKTNFRSVLVAEQLQPDAVAYYKSGSAVKVHLDDQQEVELIKQTNCELHNIVYLDLFRPPSPSFNTLQTRYLYAADSPEQCASLFVTHNLKTMHEDVRQAANSLSSLALGTANDLDLLKKQLKIHHESGRHLQRNFFYLDSTLRTDIAESIKSRLRPSNLTSSELIDGYCVFNDPLEPEVEGPVDKTESKLLHSYIKMEIYSFRYELFYERRFGVKLKASPLNATQENAYKMVYTEHVLATEDMFRELKLMVELGENFQDTWNYDLSACAQTCFRQTLGPWPACRSFDTYTDQKTGRTYCQLNSITLRQAIAMQRFDLIEDSSEQVSHYEPHSGFTLDEALLWSEVELAKGGLFSSLRDHLGVRIHVFGGLFIVLLGLIGGAILGVVIGRRITKRLESAPDPRDRDELVSSKVKIQFNSLVNDEGNIVM